MTQRLSRQIATLLVVEFLIGVIAVYLGAFFRFAGNPSEFAGPALLSARAVVFGAVLVLGLTAMGLYQSRQRLNAEGVSVRVIIGFGFATGALALIYFVLPVVALGRGWWAISVGIALVLIALCRAAFARLVDHDLFRRRVVVYGAGKRAAQLLKLRRRSDQRGFQIVAFVPVAMETDVIDDERVDREGGTLLSLARKHDADEIVIAMDERRQGFPIKDLLDAKFVGIDVVDILSFLEREQGKINVDLMNPSWMIFSEGFTRRSSRAVTSRMFDLAVTVVILALAWPLMVLAVIAILVEDGWPVLYRQQRVGMLGREFEVIKFRSMRKNAEEGTGARWATTNDSRITRVGAVIRKLRLDELPQLFNVIRGDMRFIGPRPERPEFVKELVENIPYYHERHCVKPGLTGWAQLSYPYGSSERDALEKLQFDLYYVKNQSLTFDLMILLLTVEVVLWGRGAR